MNTETQKSIYAKLMTARKEFHQRSIVKTGYNEFSKYHYFELTDFLVAGMEIMAANDMIPIISFETELATMTVYDITCEATIVITSPMSEATLKACQPVQSLGAVETFQRRYLWMVLLEIVEHDVIEESTEGNPEDTKPVGASEEQLAQIQDYKDEKQIPANTQDWIDKYSPLTAARAAKVILVLIELNK